MNEELAWQWLVQLLLALSYCHSKKILHRDVKSQNIFISEGRVSAPGKALMAWVVLLAHMQRILSAHFTGCNAYA